MAETVSTSFRDGFLKTLKHSKGFTLVIRERDESLNTALKLFQFEQWFVLISFSDDCTTSL